MTYVPYPSGTMLIPSGVDGKHLFIVVTNRCVEGLHMLFSVSSVKNGIRHDNACEFAGGEHEFIKHPSYVYYRLAEQRRADSIAKLVASKYFDVRDDLDAEYFKRVCEGVGRSKFIKPWAVKYFDQNKP